MSEEISRHMKDMRWFHSERKRRGLLEAAPGEGSEFAERVAIKLEGNIDLPRVICARCESLNEMICRL